jgi:hypothetical protein
MRPSKNFPFLRVAKPANPKAGEVLQAAGSAHVRQLPTAPALLDPPKIKSLSQHDIDDKGTPKLRRRAVIKVRAKSTGSTAVHERRIR